MLVQLTLATAFLASAVLANPLPYDVTKQPQPHALTYGQSPQPTGNRDISVTDVEDCDEDDKWTKKWSVSTGPTHGSEPKVESHHSRMRDQPQPQPERPSYRAHVPVRKPKSPSYAPSPTTPTPPASTTEPKHDDFIQSILDKHNSLRAKHQAPPLVWDQKLADHAAGVCNTCVFEHSGGPYGENLSAGSNIVPADSVQSWYDEVSKYDWSNPGFSMQTGHFTQVIWKATTKVGCYLRSDCSGMAVGPYFFTCNYEIAGNMMGSFPQNVLGGGGSAPPPSDSTYQSNASPQPETGYTWSK